MAPGRLLSASSTPLILDFPEFTLAESHMPRPLAGTWCQIPQIGGEEVGSHWVSPSESGDLGRGCSTVTVHPVGTSLHFLPRGGEQAGPGCHWQSLYRTFLPSGTSLPKSRDKQSLEPQGPFRRSGQV